MTRRVDVPPERLERWLHNFGERHGGYAADGLTLTGADGAVATLDPPFPPLADASLDGLLAHVARDRRVALLLVRLGGYAAGVFDGRTLAVSKVDSRQVHGRSAAGGWSQQRFARRREGQVAVALGAAADTAARVLLPEVATLEAVVTGGEKTAVAAVLEDRRLAPLLSLVVERVLTTPDPKRVVLEAAIDQARAVVVTLRD